MAAYVSMQVCACTSARTCVCVCVTGLQLAEPYMCKVNLRSLLALSNSFKASALFFHPLHDDKGCQRNTKHSGLRVMSSLNGTRPNKSPAGTPRWGWHLQSVCGRRWGPVWVGGDWGWVGGQREVCLCGLSMHTCVYMVVFTCMCQSITVSHGG